MAYDAQSVQNRIKELGGDSLSSVKKEIADLHTLLAQDEEIHAVVSGLFGTGFGTWLITLTNMRILFTYNGRKGTEKTELALAQIKHVSAKIGNFTSDLLIDMGDETKKITGVPNDLAPKFQDVVSRLLRGETIPLHQEGQVGASSQPQEPTKSGKGKTGCFAIIFLIFFTSMMIAIFEEKEVKQELPWTPTQIMQSYNSVASVLKLPMGRHDAGGWDDFIKYTLTSSSDARFTHNEDGEKATGIIFIGKLDGSRSSENDILRSAMAMVITVTPSFSRKAQEEILRELGFSDRQFGDGIARTTTAGVVQLGTNFDNSKFSLVILPY